MAESSVDRETRLELNRLDDAIERFTREVENLDSLLVKIEEENNNDNVSRQIMEYQAACERNPADIPAEDALETITRLQNTLKIIRRRNNLLAKENSTQERILYERSKFLADLTAAYNYIVAETGWHEHLSIDHDDFLNKCTEIQEMEKIEAVVQLELRAAQTIVKKKEALVVNLQAQLDAAEGQETLINSVYNDIRVKERDCHEVEMQLARLRKGIEKTDEALALFDVHESASLAHMRCDRDYLKETVAQMKVAVRRQENVIKAQLTRQQQLQARLDIVMRSLRDMKLDKKYERNVPKSALVPSASREEPEDVSKILPEEEFIPIHTFRLLYKNNEMLRVSVMRKNMLVLEKGGVIEALEAGLSKYANALVTTHKEQHDIKESKEVELGELMDDLQQRHQNFVQQLDELRRVNGQLKKKMVRRPRSRVDVK
ncbi:hypothetical protein ERJ75_001732100 [Trypanosoma vivax]|uniref:Uncharacterized protein n=1 Tax=Trypanosoma vivax (strain Y486) TaxID=1055687 RepID=G0U357_TRYVY|nr:hypothetical protein TRVL_05898 [Trypanosoma vivax]KAH8604280.1 hypothetical protein ERJ75_001732100 [Trypanosoma vivax]CCC50712.1 conserved hypothetical protein [Trypanosoma vivax Y486]